ncbi:MULTISPECIES: alpha/beta hydrolase [unclassified Arthrobacter]|uniref:RBBP9/YdeN family alpha/beta hydrolase n=1 Tax=unclassified Arthrobacter TaxID=235627 RepID=UPI002105F718|nr:MULTISPECIES: alpha/beta fold hydrolase [unclassified Arthrobacter]MCQ1945757.1 alpha/beta fold hydrolase [Arthrobacter sp. zg-Y1116]MCQ1994584.1 alpha/beta fold hydrolase [Arthrobacter sp. zg-Y1171]UWX81336.1 alpha/beta fold hydrolase [Arthrobacter sp. zg-Y1171]
MHITMVPGYQGSPPEQWQSRWEAELPDVTRIAPSSWDEPELQDWMAALDRAAGAQKGQTVLVAHSLGCLAAVEWLHRNPDGARGVFLVSPPDPVAASFPQAAETFRNPRMQELPVPGLLIASESDPYCALPSAQSIAAAWKLPVINAGELAHINEKSGVGYWEQGRDLLTAFTAGLGEPAAIG